MVQVNYRIEGDELEVVFEETDNPEVVRLSNGVSFEFTPTKLSAIVLPNFAQMVHMSSNMIENADLEFDSFNSELLKIKFNEQNINVKLDLDEIENC